LELPDETFSWANQGNGYKICYIGSAYKEVNQYWANR